MKEQATNNTKSCHWYSGTRQDLLALSKYEQGTRVSGPVCPAT